MNAWAFLLFLFVQVTNINAQFTAGNLVVYQIGDGSGTLTSAATAIFLKEVTTAGVSGITVNMPTSGGTRLTSSGSATSDGQITRSADGQYLVIAGYDAALGTASVTGTASSSVNRVINIVDNTAAVTRAASTSTLYSGNNFRSAARSSNSDFWGAGGTTGTHYFGNTNAAATVQSDKTNSRVVNIYNGNLYFSTSSTGGSNANLGIYQVGSGLPFTSGQTITNIINTGTGSSPYAFAINSTGNIVYIADDRTSSSGGIQKWTFDGSVWALSYTLGTGVANIGARGLTVDFSGANPVIYATTGESSANRLIQITDTGAGSAATTIATAPTNTAFRGVAFAPAAAVTTPSVTLALSSNNGDETNQTSITVTANTSAAVSGNQTIDVAVSGTGITGTDYTLSNSSITILDGTTSGAVTFTIADDNASEGSETATLSLENPSSGILLGSPVSANIAIADNDVASVIIEQSGGNTNATEGGATDTYDIRLATQPTDDVTINIAGDAQASASASSILFTTSDWNTNQTITVTAIDDNNIEGNHSASIAHTATSTDANYNGISVSSVPVTVTDNDVSHTLVFVRADTTVSEGAGTVKVWLRVSAAGNTAGTVDLAVSNYSTASGGGTDYSAPVTLNVPANLVLNQLIGFDFTITDDGVSEADEYIICKVSNTSNVTVSSAAQSTLYIKDNDTPTPAATNQLGLNFVTSFSNGASGSNSAEISAYDSSSKRLFIANSVANKLDILNLTNPAVPVLVSSINLSVAPFSGAINSVAAHNGKIAIALEGLTDKQANGKVVFVDVNGNWISEVATGAMPDMITFNHAGTKVYTANEGEPNAAYTIDPEGSISVIDISGGVLTPTAVTIAFTAYNGQEAALRSQCIRIFGLNASASQDFEPEYITISDDDSKAWVTLQENNAIVELNLTSNAIVNIIPLGYKDHSLAANAMDASDQTFDVNISNFPVKGMYQPDAVASYTSGGNTYLITANEGDARGYSGFSEESRVSGLNLDATVYPNASDIKNNAVLGRLNATNKTGDIDNDGDIDTIHVYGSRSFTIWNPAAATPLVFDSKDQLERITLNHPTYGAFFNMSNGVGTGTRKNRSDDKGPEPEGVVTTKIGGRDYAFIALERIGGVIVYDVTNPTSPAYVTYQNNRQASTGDRGAEGIFFIPANESPNGKGLVVLSNEVSSTITIYEVNPCTAPGIATIANEGNTALCPDSTVKLFNVNSNSAYTYQWLKDDAVINNATDSVFIASMAGSYKLIAFNASGCVDTSAAIIVSTASASTVNLSVSSNTASETAGTVVTVTATASAPVCGDQTVSLDVTGAGITGLDYSLSNTTITIATGSTSGSVTFTVANDNVVEPTETAVLTISNPSSGIVLGGTDVQNISISDFVFTLQVLHASDFEAAVDAVTDAPRFAAIVDTLEESYTNTIKLSSGDNYIPGPFLSSGEDASLAPVLKTTYERYYNTTFTNPPVNLLPSIGRADISIMNFIGFEASALGNHEFDLGTNEIRNIIRGNNNSSSTTTTWFGAQFPYLSANLNFSGDPNLSSIATTNRLLPNTAFRSNPSESISTISNKLKLAPSTTIIKGGQKIGIVGATTQVLASISSPGATTVIGGDVNDMDVLAGILQPVINDLIADGCNKIILLSHLQQIALEKELAGKLSGVDIIMAGGSNTLMADANDRLRSGDVAVETYPFLTTGFDGKALVIVNTDGNYKYVGRLVVDFDADGTLLPSSIDPLISGVYAADAQGLTDAWGANIVNAFTAGTRGSQVQLICTAIGNVINTKDGSLFGKTSVFLEGRRNFVRTEETNLGNVTAEANLWMSKFYDPTTVISIKNGGGIRSAIGNVIAVGSNVTLVPPIANPSAGKQSGDISQLDIENSLRFNNQLSLLTLNASGLRSILEHAVAATTATATPGQFAQVAGVRYSYNFSNAVGSRILNAVITDGAGNIVDTLVLNGATYGNLARTFRVVTLNFLANGGDGYPFNTLGSNRVDLNTLPDQGPGVASFTNAGSEQDAFAEFMKSVYNTTPYGIAETPLAQDCRIQRVPARTDNVLPPNPGTNGTLTICSGSTVTEAQLFAALGGSPATGGTWSPALAGAGVYTYTVTSPSCAGSASATVTVTAVANTVQISLNVQGAIACVGGTTVMSVSATGGTAPYSGTGNFVVSAGPRTYTVTDAVGCSRSASFTLQDGNITAPATAPSRITLSQNRNLCNTIITATCTAAPNAASYEWTVPTGTSILSGQGTQTISLNISGSFTTGSLTVRGVNACGNGPSSAPRSLDARPSRPIVSGPLCVAPNATGLIYSVTNPEAGVSYNWQVPNGATIVNGQGTATVEVNWRNNAGLLKCTALNSCATSNRAVLSIATSGCAAVASTSGSNWIIYPNPTIGNTSALITAKAETKYSLVVSDLSGKILIKKEFITNAGQNKVSFDMGAYAAGMYLVTIASDADHQTFKLLKQ